MMKKSFLLFMVSSVYLLASADVIVFEDTPVIDGVHKKVAYYKKHTYKKRYKRYKAKSFKSTKNDAIVAKDELLLPED